MSGNLISILENANKGKYTQRVNEPAQLSFEVPASDSKVSDLTKPNEIWLRDYSTGTLIRKFVITRLVKKDSGNCTYQVECKGYLSKLLKMPVVSYNPVSLYPAQILTGLWNLRIVNPSWKLGTVDITGLYSFSWSNTNVLKCLNDCLEAWGGFFDVDDNNKLTWLDDIGSDLGQQIRYRKNLVTVEVETDYEGQNSRIYATGNSLDLMDYKPSFDPVDKSADASFGYLTLQDYKCYSAWTGDGDALPYGFGQDVTVYRVTSEFSISFFSCSGAGWTDPANAIDGSLFTSAYYNVNGWTGYLTAGVNVTPELCTGLRWYVYQGSSHITDIEVQYSINGTDWITVVDAWDAAWDGNWGQYDFAEPTLVKYMRLRVRTNASYHVYVYEMEMRTTYNDDTADFVQGANEQIVKCAIGDYHSGDTYYLGYTHALYIKDFTAAATYGDEAINASFNYAGDAETLLKYAQAQMALIKDPPKYYQSGIIFLNEVDTNFSFEELDLGNIVKIIHEPLNVEDSVRIVAMTQDLDNPANGSIEIQTKIRSLADSFRALWARI